LEVGLAVAHDGVAAGGRADQTPVLRRGAVRMIVPIARLHVLGVRAPRVAEAIVALRDAVVQQRGRVVDRSHALEARERLVEAAVPEQVLAFAERGAKRGAILGADAIGEEAGTRRKVPEVRGRQAQQQLDTTLATAPHDPIETLAEVLVTLREL